MKINELTRLRGLLEREGIAFKNKSIFSENDGINVGDISVICHEGSYGGERGYCEIMADFISGDVKGWLTAEDCCGMIKNRKEK